MKNVFVTTQNVKNFMTAMKEAEATAGDPALLVFYGQAGRGKGIKGQVSKLPRAEAEKIEAEASRMKVLDLKPAEPDPVYMTEPDRYEALIEMECREEELSLDDMQFMRYFEKTGLYKTLKDRFEFLREHY